MSRRLSVDSTAMRSQVEKMRSQLGTKYAAVRKACEEATRATARRAAVDLALATFPAIGAMIHATRLMIAHDIRTVFITAGGAFEKLKAECGEPTAKRFYAAYKRGNIQAARDILRRSGCSISSIEIGPVSPEMHQAARTGYQKKVNLRVPRRIVPADQLAAYIAKVQKRIGEAAAGWSACAAQLGGEDGIPNWKSTNVHGMAGGEVQFHNEAGNVGISLVNRLPHIRRLISPGQVARIQRAAGDNLRAELQVRLSSL